MGNLIKIQLFVILSYKDLTVALRRSCADDLCNFQLGEFHQPIKMFHTSNFESLQLSESGKLRFDWLTIKVICTWPPTGHCQIFIWSYNEEMYFNQIARWAGPQYTGTTPMQDKTMSHIGNMMAPKFKPVKQQYMQNMWWSSGEFTKCFMTCSGRVTLFLPRPPAGLLILWFRKFPNFH